MRNIGKYRLLELLGHGGMARVFKVMHLERKTLLALKLLRPSEMLLRFLGHAEIKRRFVEEARVMNELRHPRIAAVHDIGEDAGHSFFVQEYLCFTLGMLIGESEFAERPSRPLSPLMALRLASQTLDGLGALHEAGVVHRDVKPGNLMLTRQGDVKIIDLGLSRHEGSVQKQPRAMVVGSPYYAAPEQEEAPEAADPRADLYSVGVVLYRMVTGTLPETRRGHTDRYSLLGPAWPQFLETALADDPNKRFPDTFSMKRALAALGSQWEKRRDQVCRLPETEKSAAEKAGVSPVVLRKKPVHTGRKRPAVFPMVNPLMQPAAHVENAFEETKDGTLDRATSLVWAKSVSDAPLDLAQAMAYVGDLNRRYARQNRLAVWRLPTIDELVSLMSPRHSLEGFCRPSLAQLKHVTWLWSTDVQTIRRAWIADLDQGSVLVLDRMCRIHVLPVRDSTERQC